MILFLESIGVTGGAMIEGWASSFKTSKCALQDRLKWPMDPCKIGVDPQESPAT